MYFWRMRLIREQLVVKTYKVWNDVACDVPVSGEQLKTEPVLLWTLADAPRRIRWLVSIPSGPSQKSKFRLLLGGPFFVSKLS